jgi:DNA-binding beta-propeller fold protein YncE
MRPYFAIIEDSFREAMSSRVLWLLLAVNLLVLLCLTPFGYLEQSKVDLLQSDVGTFDNRLVLIQKLMDGSKSTELTPAKHIYSVLDAKTKERFEELSKQIAEESEKGEPEKTEEAAKPDSEKKEGGDKAADGKAADNKAAGEKAAADKDKDKKNQGRRRVRIGEDGGLAERLPEILNKALRKDDFYNEEAWKKVVLGEEAQDLKKQGLSKLTADERGRFNRLALEAAFRGSFEASPRTEFKYTLFGYNVGNGEIIPAFNAPSLNTRARFEESLMNWVRFILAWFVGAIGVFISILITSSIVPDTFDTGSLHLLLSKPLTRTMLFLSKFTGACVFTLFSACVLLGGVFLILGLRFGLWNPQLFLCIPIYVFVFAIYYSVSAFVGLVFRSPIISIAAAVMFWLTCFALGFGPYWMRDTVLKQVRIARVVPLKDGVLGMSEVYTTRLWDPDKKVWNEAFNNEGRALLQMPAAIRRLIPFTVLPPTGTYYDPKTEQLISVETTMTPGSFMSKINFAKGPDFKQNEGPNAPLGTITLLPESDGKFVIVAQSGIYRGDTTKLQPAQNQRSMFGFALGGGTQFDSIGPAEPLVVDRPAQAALDHASGTLVVYSRGNLTTLQRNAAGKFDVNNKATLPDLTEEQKNEQGAAMAVGGNCLVVALESGRVFVLDTATLKVQFDQRLQGKEQPHTVSVSPDGSVAAILFHNGRLFLSRSGQGERQFVRAAVRGQGDISAAAITDANTLYTADLTQRVTKYKLSDLVKESEVGPKLGWFEISYRYGVAPLYRIFPKPGELEKTIRYILAESPSQPSDLAKYDLMSPPLQKSSPWAPVISSGAFLLVMLLLSCFYIERQEY